jgi:hypothetical protein
MTDNSSVPVASGNETFANNDIGGVKYPRNKVMWGPAGTANETDVATGKPLPVQVRSATGLSPIGEPTDAAATQTDATSVTHTSIFKQISKSIQAAATSLAGTLTVATHAVTQSGSWVLSAGAALIGKVGIDQTTDGATNKVAANVRHSDGTVITDATGLKISTSQLAALQTAAAAMSAEYQLVGLPTDQPWPKGLSNKAFVAAFTTLTRPANQTPYAAGDSISDNATAGSVTALFATVSDTNDDPIFINEILVSSTDTGLAGKRIRAYLFNSDPTASTGVGGGDNAAYSQKKAGYLGSFSGVLESGFSDGAVGRLVPTFADGAALGTPHAMAGGFITVKPTAGAKTIFIQYQAVDIFTSSANSTTIIGTARGWQGRAA